MLSGSAAEPGITGVYLFGSSISDKENPSDVDVLVVYCDGNLERGHELAEAIRALPTFEVYDVLAMSDSEERELGFLGSETAYRVWPLTVETATTANR
jgi:predicted nucleotidyltransferase